MIWQIVFAIAVIAVSWTVAIRGMMDDPLKLWPVPLMLLSFIAAIVIIVFGAQS